MQTEQTPFAEFDGLKLRAVNEHDRPALEEWIAADPGHASILDPDFFMGMRTLENGETVRDPRPNCFALEDDDGVVFFIRLSRAARVHIQFPPARNRVLNPKRTGLALLRGMAYLEVGLMRAGAEEWIFQTEDRGLKRYAEKALGFAESPREMIRTIGVEETNEHTRPAQEQPAEGGA